jgi:hypothetical protein
MIGSVTTYTHFPLLFRFIRMMRTIARLKWRRLSSRGKFVKMRENADVICEVVTHCDPLSKLLLPNAKKACEFYVNGNT